MTLNECIKKRGLQIEVGSLKVWQSVDVCFINSNGQEDETQFDVKHIGTKPGNDELEELFNTFCNENGFSNSTVQSITVVKSANSYEELEERSGDIV